MNRGGRGGSWSRGRGGGSYRGRNPTPGPHKGGKGATTYRGQQEQPQSRLVAGFRDVKTNYQLPHLPRYVTDSKRRTRKDTPDGSDSELDLVEPPPPDKEYPTCPTPPFPPPEKLNLNGREIKDDPESLREIRNEEVRKYLGKPPPSPPTLQLLPFRRPRQVEKIRPELQDLIENDDIYTSDQSADPDGDDGASPMFLGKPTVQQIIARAEEDRRYFMKQQEGSGPASFSHFGFQRALEVKWHIMELHRLEKLLRGNFADVEKLPLDLRDFEGQFRSIYGPLDMHHEEYDRLLLTFKTSRLEMMISMMKTEDEIIKWIFDGNHYHSHLTKEVADYILAARLLLEEKLDSVFEAKLDLNPYTSPLRMDFFVLPRPRHALSSYILRPSEFDNFLEFPRLDDNAFIREGYNAAVLDVGWKHSDVIPADFPRDSFFDGSLIAEKKQDKLGIERSQQHEQELVFEQLTKQGAFVATEIPNNQEPHRSIRLYIGWKRHLSALSKVMMEHPMGIEINQFIKKFRDRVSLEKDERLFGDLKDVDGIKHVKDLFCVQELGNGALKKEILFHGFLEGMIIPPGEILLRIWKRLRYLLQHETRIELMNVRSHYNACFGHGSIVILNWGFRQDSDRNPETDIMKRFINYSIKVLPEELHDIEMVEVKKDRDKKSCTGNKSSATAQVDSKEQEKDVTKKSDAMRAEYSPENGWFIMDGPIPDYVCCNVKPDNDGLGFNLFDTISSVL